MRPQVHTRQGRKGPGPPARRGLVKAKTALTRAGKLVGKQGKEAPGKSTPKKVQNVNAPTKNISKTTTPKVSQKPSDIVKATSPERKKETSRLDSRLSSPGRRNEKEPEGKTTSTEKKKDHPETRKSTSLERKKETVGQKKINANASTKKASLASADSSGDGKSVKNLKKKPLKKTVVKKATNKKKVVGGVKNVKKDIKSKPSADPSANDRDKDTIQLVKPVQDESETSIQPKCSKERARSPEKRKRPGSLRSSSAPLMPSSDNNKSLSDDVSRVSKLTTESSNLQNSPKKPFVPKKGNKVDTKVGAKPKDAEIASTPQTEEQPFNREPSSIQSINSTNWLANQKCSGNDKDSGILMKMPFLDSQLVSPLGRKKLVGKVKPIARVKGTVIESKKIETDKKATPVLPIALPSEDGVLRISDEEVSEQLNIDIEKKKCPPLVQKTTDDLKKSAEPLKSSKPTKKLELGKTTDGLAGKSGAALPKSSLPKLVPALKTKKAAYINAAKLMNKRPKIGVIKGRPMGKKANKVAVVKGIKLTKKLFKESLSCDKPPKSSKDSTSSSDEVTYSFPEGATGTTGDENTRQSTGHENKSAMLKKPKVVKRLPKKIQLVKSNKKPENVLNKSVKLNVNQNKDISKSAEEKCGEETQKADVCDLTKPDTKDETQEKSKETVATAVPVPEPPLKGSADADTADALAKDSKEALIDIVSAQSTKPAEVSPSKSVLDKKFEISHSTDENSDDEERFAFPKIKKEVKSESVSPKDKKKNPLKTSPKPIKKFITIPTNENKHRMKLLGFWTGPKKHREASLNALAKVQCMYENESRSHHELGLMRTVERGPVKWKDTPRKKLVKTEKRDSNPSSGSEYERKVKCEMSTSSEDESSAPTRTLRYQPAGAGKYWDMKLSSSEESEAEHRKQVPEKKKITSKPKIVVKTEKTSSESSSDTIKAKKPKVCPPKKRRNRTEVVMDLRDMVVRKRMASLNATAMLAASYEKRSPKSNKDETTSDSTSSEQTSEDRQTKKTKSYAEKTDSSSRKDFPRGAAEVSAPKPSMAVIVNQEADVTITGVYSTHAGYCTVSEMQYRISATSHTQTTATAASEKETTVGPPAGGAPGQGYTPLGALSSMHPPGGVQPHLHPGPSVESRGPVGGALGRRAGCSSAFSAPHHHQDPERSGYYQPAGPLISAGPLHGGFKGAEAASPPPPPPPQDPPYSRYPYNHPQQVMHYGSGYPPYGGGYGAMGAPAVPPPSSASCYRPPPGYRPPPPDNQGPPGAGEAYAPQYCAPCYQHQPHPPHPQHVPSRSAITYLDPAYQGCPCPMQSCPKNVHTGPATGNPPVSGGPGKASARAGGGGNGGGGEQRRPALPPESLGPPSPARGSAGRDPPHPPKRARLGKAMARKSITPGDTGSMLLACCPRPPPPPLKTEADSGDEIIILDESSKMAPIDLSSSPDIRSPDSKSDCIIMRIEEQEDLVIDLSSDTKKENTSAEEVSPTRLKNPSPPETQALKEHNADNSVVSHCELSKKSADVKPKTGTKRRCSNLDIDMEVDMDDSLAANGIGEHVKLQKRQKVSITDSQGARKNSYFGSYKDLIKKNIKDFKLNNGKRQLNTIKTEKSKGKGMSLIDSDKSHSKRIINKRKSVSPSVRDSPVNKRKRFTNTLLKLTDQHSAKTIEDILLMEKPRQVNKKSIMPTIPKSKYVLDNLMMKNNLERVIESVVKNVSTDEPISETDPAVLFSTPKSPIKSSCTHILKPKRNSSDALDPAKSPTVLNINNNVVKKVNEAEMGENSAVKVERKLSTEKRGRTKSKSPAAINRVSEKKQKETAKGKVDGDAKDPKPSKESAKTRKVTKYTKGLGKRRGKSSEGVEIVESGLGVEPFREMPLLRRGPLGPRWSNGWIWEGEPQQSKVYVNNEESCIVARCWSAMRHSLAGDTVRRGDSVLLRAGVRRSEPPFVARVSQLWENPTDGEMMVSLLWYYRPEHTERGRQPEDCADEVFASRHRDANSVACIEDKCYVLTYNEYCRYRKQLRATEENVRCAPSIVPSMPSSEVSASLACDARVPPGVAPELVLFCRRVYDFRLKKVISVTSKGKAYYN